MNHKIKLGLEVFCESQQLTQELSGKRVGLLCHAASVDQELIHAVDRLSEKVNLSCLFGPQHGIHAEKQDNMVESDHSVHKKLGIPIYSLYGEVRRPTTEMMNDFDVLLVDLQDVGCRIYTFLTTLFYMMEACSEHNKQVVVLDRPNPAARALEGSLLDMNWQSFVGAAPVLMRHGLTLGEAGHWYKQHKELNLEYSVVPVEAYNPSEISWHHSMPWVNPSPNLPRFSATQMYPGTVLLEGTTLSEGRGTTRPLELFGAPYIQPEKVLAEMKRLKPEWLEGALVRPCFFEPTFHKHQGRVCGGLQLHVDWPGYDLDVFKPYRLVALFLKVVRQMYPKRELWSRKPYEYEFEKLPIDLLSGNEVLRKWVDDSSDDCSILEQSLSVDEGNWLEQSKPHFIYK